MSLGRYCGQRFSWSLVSDGSELTLRLSDVPWMTGTHRITLEYEAIGMFHNVSTFKQHISHFHQLCKRNNLNEYFFAFLLFPIP